MGRKKNVDPSQGPLMKCEMVVASFEILMQAYIGSLGRCSSGQKVTIIIKSYNRNIKFSGFMEYFDICFYKSGNIDSKMRESCHADYLERIYEYEEDRAQQEAFLQKLREGFAEQFIDVANCILIDYYRFMDMLRGEWHFKDSYEYFTNLVAEYEDEDLEV